LASIQSLIDSLAMRGHDRQNPVSNSDVANLNSVVPNRCFIRTEFKHPGQNLELHNIILNKTKFRTTK
jgi:hypothetical protein